jgi:hypothetical protein
MKKESVTTSLLRTILAHYPTVPSYLIHCAGRRFCLSGGQRLRDLKKKGLRYIYEDHKYTFLTPKQTIEDLLMESTEWLNKG